MHRRAFLKTAGVVAALGSVPSIGRGQGKEVKLGYLPPETGPHGRAHISTNDGLKYTARGQTTGNATSKLTMNNMAEKAKNANVAIKRVAMMHEDGNFGTTMGNHVEAFGAKLGYTMVQRIPYSLKS